MRSASPGFLRPRRFPGGGAGIGFGRRPRRFPSRWTCAPCRPVKVSITAILSANARSQLRRAMRKLEPVTLEKRQPTRPRRSPFSGLSRNSTSLGGSGATCRTLLSTRSSNTSMNASSSVRSPKEPVQLLRLRSGDRTLGVLYNFRRGNRVYAYQSGFIQPEAHERPVSSLTRSPSNERGRKAPKPSDFSGRREPAEAQLREITQRRSRGRSSRSLASALRVERRALGGSRSATSRYEVVTSSSSSPTPQPAGGARHESP